MTDTQVSFTLQTDPVRVAPGTQLLFVDAAICAQGIAAETLRPRLTTLFVLDISGSMQGPPLEQVVRSVHRLVELLAPDDELGVVAYADQATLVAPLAPLSPASRRALNGRLAGLQADGCTNLEGGLRLARSQFSVPRPAGRRQTMLLLTDGLPNVGESSPTGLATLARRMRADVSLTTLGYGPHHDENLLTLLADNGGGVYRFISDPITCLPELTQALGNQGDVVIDAVELLLRPGPGVELVRVLGAPPSRVTQEGLLVTLPDLHDRMPIHLVVELKAAFAPTTGRGNVLGGQLRYRLAGQSSQLTLEARAEVQVAPGPAQRAPEVGAQVLLARADEVRSEARVLADRGQFDGAAVILRGLMAEIAVAPGYRLADGSPLSEAYEMLLDEAIAMERHPAAEAYNIFRKSSSGQRLTRSGVSASSRSSGNLTLALSEAGAGPYPQAELVQLVGPTVGQRYRLAAQNTIGRTSSADISIPCGTISRRHLAVFALAGEFWVADLGSSNAAYVNGQQLRQEPHLLKHGDQIKLGEVQLRYEEV